MTYLIEERVKNLIYSGLIAGNIIILNDKWGLLMYWNLGMVPINQLSFMVIPLEATRPLLKWAGYKFVEKSNIFYEDDITLREKRLRNYFNEVMC